MSSPLDPLLKEREKILTSIDKIKLTEDVVLKKGRQLRDLDEFIECFKQKYELE